MASTTEANLTQALVRGESIAEIARGLRNRDAESTTAAIANFVVTLASEVPWVGKLAAEGARWAFARSAYGRLERVAAEISHELDQAAQERRIAESVAELVAQRLAELGQGSAESSAQGATARETVCERVRVEQVVVDEGATGVALSEPKGRDVDVTQKSVSGRGTVGVKL